MSEENGFIQRARRLQAEADEARERWEAHVSNEIAGEGFTIKFNKKVEPTIETGANGLFQWMEPSPKEKVLYVNPDETWDSRWVHAVALYDTGYSVWLHDHAPDDRCRADGAHCKCGRLTPTDDGPTLDLITPLDNNI
jgi:hypothetical protein